jgi:hypothetical protein
MASVHARLLLATSLASGLGSCARSASVMPEQARTEEAALPTLALTELLLPGSALGPSAKARALSEKRVRLLGFMADMEQASADALYMVPRPVHCDEGGGGTGDLPPDAVLLTLPSELPRSLEHIAGPVEAVGVLEIGNRADARGRATNFRLRLEARASARAEDPDHARRQRAL